MPKYNNLFVNIPKPEQSCFIYGLIDPRTNELKYIGQTIRGFSRIREHYNHLYKKRRKNSTAFCSSKLWIEELLNNNLMFDVVYIQYVNNSKELNEAELFWISYFKSIGCNLLNVFISGQPNATNTWSIENRKIISEKTKEAMKNPEIRKKLSDRLKGKPSTYKGKKSSEETRKKISERQENKIVYVQDENGNIYRGIAEAARALKCSYSGVSHAIHGRCKSIRGIKLKRM